MEPPTEDGTAPRLSKFRFKSGKDRHEDRPRSTSSSNHYYRRHHHHHRRSKRPKTSHRPQDDPATYDDTHIPNASSTAYMNPDSAFRESLFDAMADDEGASFWEGVYGQPIHNYSNVRPTGPQGELEEMSDEEYTTYVRAKMWEKTHEHVMEERARMQEEKEKRKKTREQTRRMKDEEDCFRKEMEESLKRGEKRKRRRWWRERWEEYLGNWEDMKVVMGGQGGNVDEEKTKLRNKISWPVESGRRKDVSHEEVETFFRNVPVAEEGAGNDKNGLWTVLKMERVRWHPDKMQQRYGRLVIDDETMKAVTAVFQVIDKMWNEERQRAS